MRPQVAVPGTYAERLRDHRASSAPAKCVFHRAEPPFIVTIDAVRVDPQQDLHRVPGPFGDQWRRGPGVQPPGDTRMPVTRTGTSASSAPVCSATPPSSSGLGAAPPGAPAPSQPKQHHRSDRFIRHVRPCRFKAVVLGFDCPAHGNRFNAACGAAARSATPSIDPAATHQEIRACENDRQQQSAITSPPGRSRGGELSKVDAAANGWPLPVPMP